LTLTGEGDPVFFDSGVNPDKEIATIDYWLENCQKKHPDCVSQNPGFMPSRVVDVGNGENEDPRLVLTAKVKFIDANVDN
jgi:hypothetical protein